MIAFPCRGSEAHTLVVDTRSANFLHLVLVLILVLILIIALTLTLTLGLGLGLGLKLGLRLGVGWQEDFKLFAFPLQLMFDHSGEL